jgi:hypothetical protein
MPCSKLFEIEYCVQSNLLLVCHSRRQQGRERHSRAFGNIVHLLEVITRNALGAIARDTTAHRSIETQARMCDSKPIIAILPVILNRLKFSLFQSHLKRRTLEAASIDNITHSQRENDTIRFASDKIIAVVA